jgi:hypothetical protein
MAKSGNLVILKGKFHRIYEATGEIRCSFEVGHLRVGAYFHLLASDVM